MQQIADFSPVCRRACWFAPTRSLLLRIPDPRTYLDRPDLLRFAAVHAKPGRSRLTGANAVVTDRRLDQVMRPIVGATATEAVRTVADRIGAAGQSCALVRTARGLGVVTDYDFRRQLATGRIGADAPIDEVLDEVIELLSGRPGWNAGGR